MTTTSLTTMSRSEVRQSLELVELKPGLKFSKTTLQELLPDVETALFFSKCYDLDYVQVSRLLHTVLHSDVAYALFTGNHSTELQGYLVGEYDVDGSWINGIVPEHQQGEVTFNNTPPHGEILPQVWADLEVEVADSIKTVANKLGSIVGKLPGKQGSMVFESMRVMNRNRPTIGDYRAKIEHSRQRENLLILDVSASMSEPTIRAIVDDVVALSYMANAHLAIVSSETHYWAPGSYNTEAVLEAASYGGTHYETLHSVLNLHDWGTVISVADYDSSYGAQESLALKVSTTIDEVVDVSLVDRPTFLAECLGQFAGKVTPMLIGNSCRVLS